MSVGELIDAVAWLASVSCSRWEHTIPTRPPSWVIHAASRQRLPYVLGCQAAGGLLHRRNPLSEVGHVLCRRTSLRLDETDWSQNKKSRFETALLARSVPRERRALLQSGSLVVISPPFCAVVFPLFAVAGGPDRSRPVRHGLHHAQPLLSSLCKSSVSETMLVLDAIGGNARNPLCFGGRRPHRR